MMKFIMPTFLFNIEKWKWNSEYRIYVSKMGHFKNEYKQDIHVKINEKGYCVIKTPISTSYRLVHRLVMLTWKPIPDAENLTIDHLDHNKRNNTLLNLEWVTKEENQKRAREDFVNKNYEKEPKQKTNSSKPIPAIKVTVESTAPLAEDIKIVITKYTSMSEANKNVSNKENFNRKVTDGKKVYLNAIEAAKELKKEKTDMASVKNKKIATRIISAIEFNKRYCEKEWHYVEEE